MKTAAVASGFPPVSGKTWDRDPDSPVSPSASRCRVCGSKSLLLCRGAADRRARLLDAMQRIGGVDGGLRKSVTFTGVSRTARESGERSGDSGA